MDTTEDAPLHNWLTPRQAAAYMKLCTKTLRQHDGKLRPAYLNRRVKRYSRAALDKFIDDRRV